MLTLNRSLYEIVNGLKRRTYKACVQHRLTSGYMPVTRALVGCPPMHTPIPSDRFERLDSARWLAAMAVVLLHCASQGLSDESAHGTLAWTAANIFDSAMRWCVPVFVMISGALLLEPGTAVPTRVFYGRRMARIVLPLVFWTMFYIGWRIVSAQLDQTEVPWTAWAKMVANGKPYYHLWYLYMLLGLYLFTPFVRRAYQASSPRTRLLAVGLILGIAVIQSALASGREQTGFFLTWFTPFLGYFVLGRLLFDGHVRLPCAVLLLITSIVVTAVGIHTMSSPTDLNTYFYSNFSLTVPVMAIAVYHLVLNGPKLPRLAKWVPLTFGIYLIHPALIDVAMRVGLYSPGPGPADFWAIPLFAVVVFLGSAGLTWLMRQNQMLARLV